MTKQGLIQIPKLYAIFGTKNIESCYDMEFDETGNTYNNNIFELAFEQIGRLIDYVPENCAFAVGMDRGWDEMVALNVIVRKKPLYVFIPGSLRWHTTRKYPFRHRAVKYDEILTSAEEVKEIPKKYKGVIYRDRYIARASAMIEWATDVYSCKCDKDPYLKRVIEIANVENKYRGDLLNGV